MAGARTTSSAVPIAQIVLGRTTSALCVQIGAQRQQQGAPSIQGRERDHDRVGACADRKAGWQVRRVGYPVLLSKRPRHEGQAEPKGSECRPKGLLKRLHETQLPARDSGGQRCLEPMGRQPFFGDMQGHCGTRRSTFRTHCVTLVEGCKCFQSLTSDFVPPWRPRPAFHIDRNDWLLCVTLPHFNGHF